MTARLPEDRRTTALKLVLSALVAVLAAFAASRTDDHGSVLFYLFVIVLIWNVVEVVVFGLRLVRPRDPS